MCLTNIVNLASDKYDIYIGRSKTKQFHFGNPFSFKKSDCYHITVPTLDHSLINFYDWLRGTSYQDVEPERRLWIIDNIDKLKGKTLGCYCRPKKCHGDIYRVILGEIELESVVSLEYRTVTLT